MVHRMDPEFQHGIGPRPPFTSGPQTGSAGAPPASFMRRSQYRDFIDDLSTLLESGVPVLQALENMASDPRSARSAFVNRLLERVRGGESLAEALACEGPGISAIDVGLIRAGETGGALVEVLGSIVRRLDARKALQEDLLKRSLYGLSVFMLACVLLPLYLLVIGRTGTYVLIQTCIFLPVLVLAWVVSRGPDLFSESSSVREPYERLLLGVPILGNLLAKRAFARAFEALGLLLRAGVTYREGIPLAAASIRWNTLRRCFLEVHAGLESGLSITDSLRAVEGHLGRERGWRERVVTGEEAGKADRAFLQIANDWDERFQNSMQYLLRVLPIALILLVGLIVAMRFLDVFESMYSGVP